ncbi:ATP-grasp domain-containing protein [Moorena bouillonii]|uniref:ATPase n=1 Tax=Moorena bouillonii PNG TaxID=568701 RepID=A0A1U7N7P0_9CYAN|nr:ATP-grasp domain-containing protein [Moorena bouillonii]OLT61970.1 ATPase [Moorena bouillonii PNG]
MHLLEYQAKELFCEIGIPVLPAQRIDHPTDIKGLQIPYPVVLKSQVSTCGDSPARRIRCVENTIDAIAAARAIFKLPILGKHPQVLLAESRYNAEQEFYLAVFLDYNLARPVLLGSSQGRMDTKTLISDMQKVVVEQNFSPFYGRRLAIKMGLYGNLIESVSGIINKMYQLFVQKDLDIVEINPLGVSPTGELMALDGRIAINDKALRRHQDLINLTSTMAESGSYQQMLTNSSHNFNGCDLKGRDLKGNIGIICNSMCLAATTVDLVYQAKGKPRQCHLVPTINSNQYWPITPGAIEELQEALRKLTTSEGIKVVLVNILSNRATSNAAAEMIANYLLCQSWETPVLNSENQEQNSTSHPLSSHHQDLLSKGKYPRSASGIERPHLVIRLVGTNFHSIQQRLAQLPVYFTDNLDQAVKQAVSLARKGSRRPNLVI